MPDSDNAYVQQVLMPYPLHRDSSSGLVEYVYKPVP